MSHQSTTAMTFRPNGYGRPRNAMTCADCGEQHGSSYYCDEWLTKVANSTDNPTTPAFYKPELEMSA